MSHLNRSSSWIVLSIAIVGVLSTWRAIGAVAPEAHRVSLAEAKAYAVLHNFDVLALRRGVEEMKAKTARARTPFYPKLGVVGGADGQIGTNFANTGQVAFGYGSLNVFSGFEDTYRLRIADLERDKAEIQLKKAEFRVALEVERAFHTYLFKKTVINLKNRALELNEAQKKTARARKASGLSAESDVMEFDLRDSILRSDILQYEQELEEARSQLRRLLGEEIGGSIEPVGRLQHQHLKATLADCLNRLQDESETVMLAARDVAISNIESGIWFSKWLPRIDVEGRIGYLPFDQRPTSNAFSYAALVYAKFEIFSGFDTLWERREEHARMLRREMQLRDAVAQGLTQTEIAYRKIHTIQARVDLEALNHDRAMKYYNSVLKEYGRGVKNSTDVRLAAETLYEATLKEETYKYSFLVERLELEKGIGGPVETLAVEDHVHGH